MSRALGCGVPSTYPKMLTGGASCAARLGCISDTRCSSSGQCSAKGDNDMEVIS